MRLHIPLLSLASDGIREHIEYFMSEPCLCLRHVPLTELTARVNGQSDRSPLPVNAGRVDGARFPLAELTDRVDGPC